MKRFPETITGPDMRAVDPDGECGRLEEELEVWRMRAACMALLLVLAVAANLVLLLLGCSGALAGGP